MGEAIGGVLGYAVGVAISPMPIIAVILMLFSRRAAANGVAFLLGWLAGLTVVSVVVLVAGLEATDGDGAGGWVKVVIGAVFLLLAVAQWRQRPQPGEEPRLPRWMASIDVLDAGKAVGMALLLSAVNPKNLGLTIAAAATIGAADLDAGQDAVVVGVYVLLASVTLIVPVVGYLAARERMTPTLDAMKAWLLVNNATVMAVLFLVLGAKVLGDGIVVLTG